MVWKWVRRRFEIKHVREPETKTLATIFKEAQKRPGPEQHALIVGQCARELEKLAVRVYEIHNLPPAPESGQRVVIGATFYSLYDLELLDAVMTTLQESEATEERLEIFDVTNIKTQADFEDCMPGIGKVFQPPVVGIWRDGVLKEKATGRQAAETVRRHYGLSLSPQVNFSHPDL
jgi:hypothetical protein